MKTVTILLMVWNVHGLPWFLGSSPSKVQRAIAQVNPDMFIGQEIWTDSMYKKIKQISHSWHRRHAPAGLVFQLNRHAPITRGYEEHTFKYTTWSKFDFLSSKGFQVYVNEDNLMVVNAHLDAGGDKNSMTNRSAQLVQILSRIEYHNGPVIVAGDLNLSLHRYEDNVILNSFLKASDLEIAAKEDKDYLLVTPDITVNVLPGINRNPSDHTPIIAEITYVN